MVANHHFTRIDILEQKDLIFRKIGHHRATKYFDQLNRFLSLKLSKIDFDKSCMRIIGKENISLHNHLIRSILQNAKFPQKLEGLKSKIPKNVYQKDNLLSPLGPLGKSYSITCEEDGDAGSPGVDSWRLVTGPLGVSFNSSKARRSYDSFCQNGNELPDSATLRLRLAKKLASEGLGISMDCANLLNYGVDVFMKRLIGTCTSIAGSRREDSRFYGNRTSCQMLSESNVSMLDFRVAVESNPSILGDDWPVQLEKICHYGLDE